MTTNQMLYVKFFFRISKKTPEEGMIYLRISFNTKREDFSFNQKVKVASWDNIKEAVKSSEKNFRQINQSLKNRVN